MTSESKRADSDRGTSQTQAASVDPIIMRAVCDKWRENQANIKRGKGTWPNNSDYVRDTIWDGWMAVQSCLQSILIQAGINPYEDELPA